MDFENADVDFQKSDPKKKKFLDRLISDFKGFIQLQIVFENGSSKVGISQDQIWHFLARLN